MAEQTAYFRNTRPRGAILVESEKYNVPKHRVLPGSRVKLPVEFGRSLRKVGLVEVKE